MEISKTEKIIYEAAFRLFLQKGYHDVSVKDLEKATDMSRGAFFYYQRDKKALYGAVLELYFLSRQAPEIKFAGYERCQTLEEFIAFYIERVTKTQETLSEEIGGDSTLQSYFFMLIEAHKYFPEFKDQLNEIFEGERKLWEKFVEQAQKTGEIKTTLDIKTVVDMFRSAFFGLSFETSFYSNLEGEQLHSLFNSIYQLLKK